MPLNQDLPVPDPASVAFVYNGHDITFDDKRFVCVTDMWRAAGSIPGREFKKWRSYQGANFIDSLAQNLKVRRADLTRSVTGRPPWAGTWGHWQIALAYAKHLSPEFHRFVNEAFREWNEERVNPDLKVQRAVDGYRRRGWDDQRITARIEGVVQRKLFTDTLQAHGVAGRGYAICTDAINREVLGGTAKEVKLTRGLPAKAETRDHLEGYELAGIRFAEAMASKRITDGCAHGNGPCCNVCREAGHAVGMAMAKMGLAPIGT